MQLKFLVWQVIAFSREAAGVGGRKGKSDVEADFPGAHKVAFGDVKSPDSLDAVAFADKVLLLQIMKFMCYCVFKIFVNIRFASC